MSILPGVLQISDVNHKTDRQTRMVAGVKLWNLGGKNQSQLSFKSALNIGKWEKDIEKGRAAQNGRMVDRLDCRSAPILVEDHCSRFWDCSNSL